jgi:hypothetical protein
MNDRLNHMLRLGRCVHPNVRNQRLWLSLSKVCMDGFRKDLLSNVVQATHLISFVPELLLPNREVGLRRL